MKHKSIIFVIILFFIILFSFSFSKTILFLGDSITEGYGIDPKNNYPSLIEKRINKINTNIKVINAGFSGSTTSSSLSRLKFSLKKYKIDILFLALGANDGLRGFSVEETKQNLQKTIELAKKNNITVILAGMQIPNNYGKIYTQKFKMIFPQLSTENQIELVPFLLEGVGGVKSHNLADGIHPNVKGHQIIAKTAWKYIQKVIDSL